MSCRASDNGLYEKKEGAARSAIGLLGVREFGSEGILLRILRGSGLDVAN